MEPRISFVPDIETPPVPDKTLGGTAAITKFGQGLIEKVDLKLIPYQKKADMPIAKYTGTITPASVVNDFAGGLTEVKDLTLTLSDTSVTLKTGDIIETADKMVVLHVLSCMNGDLTRGILSGPFFDYPYYCTLNKYSSTPGTYKGYAQIMPVKSFERTLTQSQYDNLGSYDDNTTYYIVEE